MKHLTIRNVPPPIAQALKNEKVNCGKSLNQTVIDILRRGLGFDEDGKRTNGLERFAGTWSEAEYQEFEEAVRPLQEVEEAFWK